MLKCGMRLAMFLCAVVLCAADSPIGLIKSTAGDVVIIRENRQEACKEGARLLVGDTIRTGPGATAGVMLFDGTRLAIAEKSELVLRRFLFEPSESKFAIGLQILRGIVVYISGKIGRLSPQSVEIQTPVGMIGTRGTTVAIRLEGVAP